MKQAILIFILFAGVFFGGLQTADAQTIIRDTEIEDMMNEWFAPIYEVAGKDPSQVNIILIQDNDVNAFVAGGANIFFYTGLLQKTDNPGEIIGVMAHELAHIDGGHLIRVRDDLENASYESIIGLIVGAAAGLASGDGGAVGTLSQGANSMAQRRFLANTRKYEASADQAAFRYVNRAGINPSGLATFLQKLESQELAPASQQSEYVRTHPLTSNRIRAIEARVESSELKNKPLPEKWTRQHKMMKAKLLGFLQPGQVIWTYDDRDTSTEALYAKSVAAYRQNKTEEAVSLIDSLIEREPNNPYFHELKGQMLVDFGRLQKGIPSYKKALSLHPDASLMRIALAHAQIETAGNDKNKLKEALSNLKRAEIDERRSSRLHRLMATAYGRIGQEPQAQLHLAEEAVLQRRYSYAKGLAEQASEGLKQGSSDWLRAQDILNFISQQKAGQNRG